MYAGSCRKKTNRSVSWSRKQLAIYKYGKAERLYISQLRKMMRYYYYYCTILLAIKFQGSQFFYFCEGVVDRGNRAQLMELFRGNWMDNPMV